MIKFLHQPPMAATAVVFVGGPREGERVTLDERPRVIDAPGGVYIRSYHCADDGALRYVWTSRADDIRMRRGR